MLRSFGSERTYTATAVIYLNLFCVFVCFAFQLKWYSLCGNRRIKDRFPVHICSESMRYNTAAEDRFSINASSNSSFALNITRLKNVGLRHVYRQSPSFACNGRMLACGVYLQLDSSGSLINMNRCNTL